MNLRHVEIHGIHQPMAYGTPVANNSPPELQVANFLMTLHAMNN